MNSMTPRRFRGTTLIEVLVVIVVFLVGILAIAQIFPGGIKILNRTRNSSMALALARSQVESFKARPDLVPEAILPISYVDNAGVYTPVDDPNRPPTEYAPPATGIDANGIAVGTGRAWQLVTGANAVRRVIGETHNLSAPSLLSPDPTQLTAPFGSLVVLEFGPMDHNAGVPVQSSIPGASRLQVYGRDLARRSVLTDDDLLGLRNYEFGVRNGGTSAAQLVFPTPVAAQFRISGSFYVNNGGNQIRRQVTNFLFAVPASVNGFTVVDFATLPGLLGGGESLLGTEISTLRVNRLYTPIPAVAPFDITPTGDPYTYKILNARVGELLFNPALSRITEDRPGSRRLSPIVRVDYDVRDWRILHEDFRVSESLPADLPKVIKLSIPSMRTNSIPGSDGVRIPSHQDVIAGQDAPNAGMEDVFVVNNNQIPGANTEVADNLLIVDLATGGQLLESVGGRPAFTINKNTGNLTLLDTDPSLPGLTQRIAFNDGTFADTAITNRALRIYYMGKDEWAVQIARNPARYGASYARPVSGQFYIGNSSAVGGLNTRIYFPLSDLNRRVSFGRIRYQYNGPSGLTEGVVEGVSAQIRFNSADSVLPSLPSVDIRDIIPNAVGLSLDAGNLESVSSAVDDVKGISMITRVFFNSDNMNLTGNAGTNLQTNFNVWARQWNITSKETYLNKGEAVR